ncbi:MAG: hypothetical protein AB4290_26675, partial [Spirulina sp.]
QILEAEIVTPLVAVMSSDREFAEELQAIAQQITNIQTQTQNQTQIGMNRNENINIKQQFIIQNNPGGIQIKDPD